MAFLLLTVDVEEDMPGGHVQAQTTLRNLRTLPALQAVCTRLGVRPTYLCTWPVATRDSGTALVDWARDAACEIGALLHPWVTPPFDANENRLSAVAPCRISVTALTAKTATLTKALAERFGTPPRSFRAALFGANGACIQVIERLGYQVDTSVVPYCDLRASGSADYRRAPEVPYFPDRQFLCQRGGASVLEVPVTVGFTRRLTPGLARLAAGLGPTLQSALRLGAGVERIRLDPVLHRIEHMCRLADVLVERDLPTLNLCVRSSDLLETEVLEKVERFLAYAIHTLGAVPRTLQELLADYAGG